jgi:hypothetical protein
MPAARGGGLGQHIGTAFVTDELPFIAILWPTSRYALQMRVSLQPESSFVLGVLGGCRRHQLRALRNPDTNAKILF